MPKLNIFIDGSWLFKVCGPEGVMVRETVYNKFIIDFNKLNKLILSHVSKVHPECSTIGDTYLVTSLFNIPSDIDTWTNKTIIDKSDGSKFTILTEHIEKTNNNFCARELFVKSAVDAGYSDKTVLRPILKDWMIKKLEEKRFQEKQVDSTVVAMLVKYAITQRDDFHAVISGDADILPAISVAYPEFTKNVLLVATHPDEMDARHAQTSYSYSQFEFKIEPLFLQQNTMDIIKGNYVHRCVECRKVFITNNAIPKTKQARCYFCNN